MGNHRQKDQLWHKGGNGKYGRAQLRDKILDITQKMYLKMTVTSPSHY